MWRTQTDGLKGIEKEFLQDLQMKAMLQRLFGCSQSQMRNRLAGKSSVSGGRKFCA